MTFEVTVPTCECRFEGSGRSRRRISCDWSGHWWSGDGEAGASQLENATPFVSGLEAAPIAQAPRLAEWQVKVYREAGEVVLHQPAPRMPEDELLREIEQYPVDREHDVAKAWDMALEEDEVRTAKRERSRQESARRARTKVRRYCKTNGLDRLITLTFRCRKCDKYCTCDMGKADRPRRDEREFVVECIAACMIELRRSGFESFPYVWVIEEHKDGALHVHAALDRPVAMRCKKCDPNDTGKGMHQRNLGGPCLRCAWGQGFVNAKRMKGRKRTGAQQVAGYVAKYVGKGMEDGHKGQQSYAVAHGYKPEPTEGTFVGTEEDAITLVNREFFEGREPKFVWSSALQDGWRGPPVRVLFFDAPGGGST